MIQAQAIRIDQHGGADRLELKEINLESPASQEILVRNTAIGVNYADIYEREGDHGGPHRARQMPITLGRTAAGIVHSTGAAVNGFNQGDRVGYIAPDSYATHTLVPADRVVKLPDHVTDDVVGGYLLRGLTAEYLLRRLYPVDDRSTVLVHAAAGGMGLLLGQWCARLGARVIGTVGSPAKAEMALQHGYDAVINYSNENFVTRVHELTDGRGVDVIYDGVGKTTFRGSLDCVRPRGMVISYGTASGNVGEFDLQLLHSKSIIVTRPTLRSWISDPDELAQAAHAFFDVLASGSIKTPIGARLPLAEAATAHRQLESRQLSAPVVLVP